MVHFLRELIQYRALINALVGKEVRVRYRGSVLGFLWTFLNPLLLMCVYALVFSVYLRIEMKNYAVFMFCGLIPWLWFSSSALEGVGSIVSGAGLLTRAMVPPQILPAVRVLANMVNFLLSLPMLLIFLLASSIKLGWALAALPLVIGVQLLFTMGFVCALSALNVHFRDISHLLANIVTLWFFVSPILYPVEMIPEKYRPLVHFNPMGVLVVSYQDIFFYNRMPRWDILGAAALFSIFMLVIGIWVFNSVRESFAEEI